MDSSLSKSHHSSFGLIDECLLEDASFGRNSSALKQSFIKLTPPRHEATEANKRVDANEASSGATPPPSNPDATIENVFINDSELKDLENDFSTFSDSDDDYDADKDGGLAYDYAIKRLECADRVLNDDVLSKRSLSVNRELSSIQEENDVDDLAGDVTMFNDKPDSNTSRNQSRVSLSNLNDVNSDDYGPSKSLLSYLTSVTDLNDTISTTTEPNNRHLIDFEASLRKIVANSVCTSMANNSRNRCDTTTTADNDNDMSLDRSKSNQNDELASIYFKASASDNQSFADHTVDSMFETVLKTKQISNLISNLSQDFSAYADFQQNQASFIGGQKQLFTDVELGLNDCTFKSRLSCEDDFDNTEQSWWNKTQQQTSTIADTTIQILNQNFKNKIDVNLYFERRSSFPNEFIDGNRQSLDNLNRIDMNKCESKEQQHQKYTADYDDITFQASTTAHDEFSFTFNTTVTNGEYMRKIGKNEMQQRIENQHAMSKINDQKSSNLKEIQAELESISNRLANCAHLKKTILSNEKIPLDESTSSRAITKKTTPTKNQQTGQSNKGSSITSTPVKATKTKDEQHNTTSNSSQTGQANVNTSQQHQSQHNNIFCGESFISSIPSNEILDSDATLISGINTNVQHQSKTLKTNQHAQLVTKSKCSTDDNQKHTTASSSISTTSVLSQQVQHQQVQQVQHQSLFSSLLANTNSNGLVPILLVPYDQVFPMMQTSMYNDAKRISDGTSNETNSMHSCTNNLVDTWNQHQKQSLYHPHCHLQQQQQQHKKISDISSLTAASSTASISSSQHQHQYFHQHYHQQHQQQQYLDSIPQRSLNSMPNIDVDRQFIDFGFLAEGCHDIRAFVVKCMDRYVDPNACLLVELYTVDVNIVPKYKHLEQELKTKLKSMFSLNASHQTAKRSLSTANHELRIDLINNTLTDVFVHVNTVKMTLYADLVRDLNQPIDVNACLSISCLANNHKTLINKIEVRVLYGNARLKTDSSIESVDFVINKTIGTNSTNDVVYAVNTDSKSIPLSNAGNIPLSASCTITEPTTINTYKLTLNTSCIQLDPNNIGRNIDICLTKDASTTSNTKQSDLKTKLIIEILPNGTRFEIPITVKVNEMTVERGDRMPKKVKARIKSSKPILAYAACNPDDHHIDALCIQNPNSFGVRCIFHLITYNNLKHDKSDENVFLFESNSKDTIMQDLNPKQKVNLVIRFQPTSTFYAHNDMSKVCQGILRITSLNYEVRCHVQLMGFIGKTNLIINSVKYQPCETTTHGQQKKSNTSRQNLFNLTEQHTIGISESKSNYEINMTLCNQSAYAKCFVVPLMLNADFNKIANKSASDSCYRMNAGSNGYLIVDPESKFNFKLDYWGARVDFNLIFLWIEYDMFVYFYRYMNENRLCVSDGKMANVAEEEETTTFNLDNYLLTKLFSSNADFNDINNDTLCSLNTTQETNMSVLLKTTNKTYDKSDLLLKYFKSSLKASLFRYEFKTSQQVPESLLAATAKGHLDKCASRAATQRYSLKLDDDKDNENFGMHSIRHSLQYNPTDNILDFTLSKSTDDLDCTKQNEVWSVCPCDVKLSMSDKTMESNTCVIYLRNNLKHKSLQYDLTYRSTCLAVEPNKGTINADSDLKIEVRARKEVLSKLPWVGMINIICNKQQKDVRVSISKPSGCSAQLNSTGNTTAYSTSNRSSATTFEQGTLLSEHATLDTLSLTPLINASFMSGSRCNEFVVGSLNRMKTNDKAVKIVRIGNDAHITFPNVGRNSSSSVELILTNTAKNHVRWKGYSIAPATIRALNDEAAQGNRDADPGNNMSKSSYSVFIITPTSGVIPPLQKQTIKIDFFPRDLSGVFTQYWEIDTRPNNFDEKATNIDSYNTKLVLNGLSTAEAKSPQKKSIFANKENHEPDCEAKAVHFKDQCLQFPDTESNQSNKMFLMINNPFNTMCTVSILPVLEPFCYKHKGDIQVKPKHYIKVPIEFRPKLVGDYSDKIVARVQSHDTVISCKLQGKCKK